MAPQPDNQAVQKAVKALIKALGYPEGEISRISIECSGQIQLFMRNRAFLRAAHVEPFEREGA